MVASSGVEVVEVEDEVALEVVVDVEKVDEEDTVLLDCVAALALVMTKTSVAESVSKAPSSHTAMEKRGETERSVVVPTIHVKLVASTWSSAAVISIIAIFIRACLPIKKKARTRDKLKGPFGVVELPLEAGCRSRVELVQHNRQLFARLRSCPLEA